MKTEAIMIDVIIDIIRLLNEGNVLPFQKDAETKIDLYNKDVELYIDYSGSEKKYYYFAELKMDDEKDDNLPQIEDILRNNEAFAAIGEPNPSDSYMILLWQIENIDESIYPYVIKIEENEFFYKKYVFYYTRQELKSFMDWYHVLSEKGSSALTEILEALQFLDEGDAQVDFLTRLLAKVPFFNPVFPKAVMNDFDKMVQKRIDGIRQTQKEKADGTRKTQKETVGIINNIFNETIESGNADIEKISDAIYQELMEE